jgi:hypothetical protein
MRTVAQTQTPSKAFYSHLHGVSGIVVQVDGQVLFFSYEDDALVPVTSYAGLTVLGECGIADCQQVLDRMHGGHAAIACGRAN